MTIVRFFPIVFWTAAFVGSVRLKRLQRLRIAMAATLVFSMLTQIALLKTDGLLSVETGLPLHLCGLFGLLSIPLMWKMWKPVYEMSAFLASPAAALTLLFPAVIDSTHPDLMHFAFIQLHVLVALAPYVVHRMGKPLPEDGRFAFLLGNGYLFLVSAVNRLLNTNYLFLRAAPRGTPLWLLFQQGTLFYVCSLEILCMIVFTFLRQLFILGNR